MTSSDYHKAIVLIHGEESRLNKVRLMALVLHRFAKEEKRFVKVHFNNTWMEATHTADGDLYVDTRSGKRIITTTYEAAVAAVKQEVSR